MPGTAISRIDVPVVPAVGLSVATAGAFALGGLGLLTAGTNGLGPCLFAVATGVDCPLCGMTHGVAALGAGDLDAAVAQHPLAPLAVALAVAIPIAFLRGRRLAVPPAALWALVAVVVATWLLRLAL